MVATALLPDCFRLVDLLLEEGLGLTLETDGDPNIRLDSAHPIEIEHPSHWLEPRTLMLTTGTRFKDHENPHVAQRELIRELVGAGVSALGYGVGVVTPAIPRALIEEANRCHFAVIAIPEHVRFMDVVSRVAAATRTADSMILRRTLQMQSHLLEAMTSSDPEADLVGRLALILRSGVVLYSEVGDVVASAGAAPLHLIRAQLRGRSGKQAFRVGRWMVSAYPIAPGGQDSWFAVASKGHELPDPLAIPAVEVTLRLLNTIERSRYRASTENRFARAALVRAMVYGDIRDLDSIQDKLEMLRFGRDTELRIVSISASDNYDGGRWNLRATTLMDALEQDIVDLAHDSRLPLLVTQIDGELVGVVPAASMSIDSWSQNLKEHISCGFSEAFSQIDTCPVRLRDAQCARRVAARTVRPVLKFEDVGISDWLLAGRDNAMTARKAARLLTPLKEGELLEFVRIFFDHHLDVTATAKNLSLHPNTVRYRIKRVEEILAVSLRAPEVISDIYLGLQTMDGGDIVKHDGIVTQR